MSRYGTQEEDAYEPGSHGRVLRNLLGITRPTVMDRYEYESLVQTKYAYLHSVQAETRFTGEFIQQMHRDWLQDIYPFAGKTRKVDLLAPPQGDVPEFRAFCPWPNIPSQLLAFEADQLARLTPCRAKSVAELASKLAEVHAEFIVIHPFREGNGRIGRWITELMSLQAGFPAPDHAFVSSRGSQRQREYYRAMSVALHRQDYEPLTLHFVDSLQRAQRSFRFE